MSSTASTNVTQLLLDWRAGKQEALDKLMPLVYDELRRLAESIHARRAVTAYAAGHGAGQ